MRTFLVRHGSYSTGDGRLTGRGHEQAQGVANLLQAENLGKVAIFSSHTYRTQQTADEISRVLRVDEVCFSTTLAENFSDVDVLANLGEELLKDLCLDRRQDIDSVVAVSHQYTIHTALANSLRPIRLDLITPGSVFQQVLGD